MKVTIEPPNKTLYAERCRAARDCFRHADIMPPFLATYMCFSVMYRALGGYGGVLRYVFHQIRSDIWSSVSNRAWWTWHLYIRCRSRGEIQELIDTRLEEGCPRYGKGLRRWQDYSVRYTGLSQQTSERSVVRFHYSPPIF